MIGKLQEVPEELRRQFSITPSNLACFSEGAVKFELYLVPALMSLIEGMHNREAVKGVVDQFDLLVTLSSKVHEECEFPELLHHQVLVSRLLIEHRLQDSCVIESSRNSDEEIGSFLVLTKLLE